MKRRRKRGGEKRGERRKEGMGRRKEEGGEEEEGTEDRGSVLCLPQEDSRDIFNSKIQCLSHGEGLPAHGAGVRMRAQLSEVQDSESLLKTVASSLPSLCPALSCLRTLVTHGKQRKILKSEPGLPEFESRDHYC